MYIYDIGGCTKGLDLILRWHASFNKKSTNNIVGSPDSMLSFPIPLRRVRIGHTKGNAMSVKECASGEVIKLTAIVTLN